MTDDTPDWPQTPQHYDQSRQPAQHPSLPPVPEPVSHKPIRYEGIEQALETYMHAHDVARQHGDIAARHAYRVLMSYDEWCADLIELGHPDTPVFAAYRRRIKREIARRA